MQRNGKAVCTNHSEFQKTIYYNRCLSLHGLLVSNLSDFAPAEPKNPCADRRILGPPRPSKSSRYQRGTLPLDFQAGTNRAASAVSVHTLAIKSTTSEACAGIGVERGQLT